MADRRRSFPYLHEKLMMACQHLMAPHPHGEDDSFRAAISYCGTGMRDVTEDRMDDDSRGPYQAIHAVLNRPVDDSAGEGTHAVIARSLSPEERKAFSEAVLSLFIWTSESE